MWNLLVEMYTERPGMTVVIVGTTAILASEIIYYFYYKKSIKKDVPSKKEKSERVKMVKKVKAPEIPEDASSNEVSTSPKCISLVIERKNNNKRNKKSRSKVEEGKVSKEELETLKQLDGRKPPELWNTVIFFPDLTPHLPKSSTEMLIWYFESARMSIHLCMYVCSHPILGNVIQKKYKEGLVVQVVTDYDTFTAHNNCGAKFWKKSGIEVRMKCTGYLMHHKFALIDEEAVLTGSLNWTKQGLLSNQENVLVSTNKTIVDLYMGEFQELWKLCDDNQDCDAY